MIQVIHRALNILELIANNGEEEVSLKKTADSLNLNQGTCANIMKTLVSRDYLKKSTGNRGYALGPMISYLGRNLSSSIDLINAAKNPMRKLTDILNESCMIGMLRKETRVSLFEVNAQQELHVVNKKEKPAYQTSSGRLLIAFLSPGKREKFIEQHGLPVPEVWEDVQNKEDLLFQLDNIRRKRLAIQVAKSRILGVAVPIEQDGEVIAGLSVFMPELRYQGKIKEEIVKGLFQTAQEITRDLTSQ